ncbi:MAG: hypothetical protein ACAH80_15795 [Alphaproteobacteria bacterium]
MKYLLPLLICLLLATPALAQDDSDGASAQQEEAAAPEAEAGTPDLADGAVPEENQTDMESLRSRAAEYKAQLAEEVPTTEEMKDLAEKYDVKPPTADQLRDFGTRHQGKFNKALDYAKQFQEFRREQSQDYESGALAPAE